ncbi:hypothetical protein SLEP1_g39588 [Rubroshorea leprosula]|uniref:Uncharacterized protein n=1 Tax=Rubroshorea leprosula TaxID=152421 RepID=A0AAV5L134_9ROSI|nr:hypothetical protein SLEP1_g39588 [Rubroshorea leprosula]
MAKLSSYYFCIMLAVEVLSFVAKSQALEGSGSMAPRGTWSDAYPPGPGGGMMAESAHIRLLGRHHDSAAGGEAILGGFVMAFVVAVACYIRVTRRTPEAAKA